VLFRSEIDIQTSTGLQGNTLILPQIPDYTLSYVYRDTAFEQLSGEDASLVYAYGSSTGRYWTVWVAVELATSMAPLHRWETCLINYPLTHGNQPTVIQLDLRDVQTQDNPPIVARYFAFQYKDTNQTQVVMYWYETARFDVNGTSQLMTVKMSLVMYPQSPADVPEVENQLMDFAIAINNYWQPIKTWTLVSLVLSQNGQLLAATTGTLLIALIVYAIILSRPVGQFASRLYSKLPMQDQLLIKAVKNAQKTGNSSTQSVANEYQKLTGQQNSETWFTQKLLEAENAGLVKKALTNANDYPTISWKSQMSNQETIFKGLKLNFL
jgi:hypothetical protein